MLLWFRGHDIRTHDNEALDFFLKNRGEHHMALVFVTPKLWQQYHWSAIKIDLRRRHLHLLKQQLAVLGVELMIEEVDDLAAQVVFLSRYCQEQQISQLVVNREFELNELQRDHQLAALGLTLTAFESDVIVPKGQLLNQSGQMFKVFTPFKKAWLNYVRQHGFSYLGKPAGNQHDEPLRADNLPEHHTCSHAWPLVTEFEQEQLAQFFANNISLYQQQRDIPSLAATSQASPYLAIGALSPRYLLTLLLQRFPDLLMATDSAPFAWLNELIWREFYRHLLYHHPRLAKHQNFNQKYDGLVWQNDEQLFQAWCEGKTGYPIVDAAMRQLVTTGWMHNRLRMVVASFLTKHLLIDWRWGERFFMEHLIDGDLAANNGGWQWAASTGCDAQPYFRIFNPIRQSERFDSNGSFIRRYLPELANVPDKAIHFPHEYLRGTAHQYWPPIVEHSSARLKAIAFFK